LERARWRLPRQESTSPRRATQSSAVPSRSASPSGGQATRGAR
jgi:hypothetical protein